MDSSLDRLLRVFSSLLVPVAAGCGGPNTIDQEQFTDDLCRAGTLQALDALEPAESVDYLELRWAEQNWDTEEFTAPMLLDASGERCSGASDAQACNDAFDTLPLESEFIWYSGGFDNTSGHRSLALTRGDEARAITTQAGLLDLLGPIDAPGDAALLAYLDGRQILCDDKDEVGADDDGYVIHTRTGDGCGNDIEEHVLLVRPDGSMEVIQTVLIEKGDSTCAAGRLPAGLCTTRRMAGATDPVGDYLARMAYLEAAAVPAFGQLARELSVHGAPRSMVRAALRSRRDEVRHAKVTARLARRFGGRPTAPKVDRVAPRSLPEVAADNAAEGCIRETYGALVAHAQARRARDPQLRRALGRIAHEETRHAALSWSLSQWAESRMNAGQRRAVARSTANALERLESELTQEHHARVHDIAGMPTPDRARSLYRGLARALFV